MTRTKFIVTSITNHINGIEINLGAVTTGELDKSFWRWTPSGSIKVNLTNDAPARDMFMVGKEYFVDFSSVDELKEMSLGKDTDGNNRV